MKIRLASLIQADSIVDGEGIRTVIWTQGCSHNCKGCHNLETHDFHAGYEIKVEEILKKLSHVKNQDGITLSGGDPFFQPEPCAEIAQYAKKHHMNIWCYTGFTFEELLVLTKTKPMIKKLLEMIDVLIDGKFEEEKKSLNLYFRGSTNQRILDVVQSLALAKPVEIEKYKEREISTCYSHHTNIHSGIFI